MAIEIKKSHKGLLHEDLGVPMGKAISAAELMKGSHSRSQKVRKRATFAKNAARWAKK